MAMRARSWLSALAVACALAAGAIGISVVRAEPVPSLPGTSPDALLASTLEALSSPPTVSGTVQTHIDLGLPQLPDLSTGTGGGGGSDPSSLLLGDQTFRLWRSSDGVRIAHLAQFQEQVLVANRAQAWAWDSQSQQAVRLTQRGASAAIPSQLARKSARLGSHPPRLPASMGDPIDIARTVVDSVRPYAIVSIGTPQVVAGRDTYTLELRPRSGRTLVGSIDIAVDAATRLPLRIQVIPRGTVDPSIELGFTSVDYGAIDPSVFAFAPPAGARVIRAAPALRSTIRAGVQRAQQAKERGRMSEAVPDVRVFGKGFGLVVAARVPGVPEQVRSLLPYGGPLASIALAQRGDHSWIMAGPVTQSVLASLEPKLP
jgi:outer membrane lipoprotein-sorting protein